MTSKFVMKNFVCLSILAMLGGSAVAGDHPDPAKVRATFERHFAGRAWSSDANVTAAATKTSPLVPFSVRGTGILTDFLEKTTCAGTTCTASTKDGCDCLKFSGNLNASQLGNASWTAQITVNAVDCTPLGDPGSDPGNPDVCCFGDGVLDATTSGKSPNKLELSLTGPFCNDPNSNDDIAAQGTYIVVTANSTNKFAASAGTGQLDLFVGDDTNATTYLSANGLFQLKSPF